MQYKRKECIMYKTRAQLLQEVEDLTREVKEFKSSVSQLQWEAKLHSSEKAVLKEQAEKHQYEKWSLEKHLKRVHEEADFYKKLLLSKHGYRESNDGGAED
jgi:cell division septum initiation protein DivIVA